MSGEARFVVCAELTTLLRTGFFAVGQCHYCKKPIQATAMGRDKIANGYRAVCNPCGFEIFRLAQEWGKSIDAALSPECAVELERQLKQRHEGN